jgi:uncharacterized protein
MAKTPTDTESSPKRRGRPPKASGALPKAEVQSAYRARLKTSGKALKWVEANFDACEQRALLARQQDDLVNALAMLEIRQQEIARLKARVGELEAEVERLKDPSQLQRLRREKRQKIRLGGTR